MVEYEGADEFFTGTESFKHIDILNPFLRHFVHPENLEWEIHVDMIRIIYRKEWGAKLPRRKFYLTHPVRNVVFVYNTWPKSCWNTSACKRILREMQHFEMQKVGSPDIKYNFLVDKKGTVYEGRGFQVSAIAPTKYYPLDDKSIVIGFIGDFRDKFEEEIDIIPRVYWDALPPKGTTKLRTPVPSVVVILNTCRYKCLRRKDCKKIIFNLQKRHFRKEMDDIKYNFMIDDNGYVYEGRGWYVTTPVPTKYTPLTSKSITIAFVGNYAFNQPNVSMVNSVMKLIEMGIDKKIVAPQYDLVTFRMND